MTRRINSPAGIVCHAKVCMHMVEQAKEYDEQQQRVELGEGESGLYQIPHKVIQWCGAMDIPYQIPHRVIQWCGAIDFPIKYHTG